MEYRIVDFQELNEDSDYVGGYIDLDTLPTLEACYFDGYGVDERLLEDVPFKVFLENGTPAVSGLPDHLNKTHYFERLREYIFSADVFSKSEDLRDDDAAIIKREDSSKSWRYIYQD